jgi:head-tail adaptor
MPSARDVGALNDRMHFQNRSAIDDGWGNSSAGQGEFETQFTRYAALRPRIGGEAVTAARLDGRQPYVVTVHYDRQVLGVTTSWRLVDKNNANRVLNIISPPADPDGTRQWLEFLAEDGKPS